MSGSCVHRGFIILGALGRMGTTPVFGRTFHAIEAVERRMDARPAKKIMVALPREFDEADRIRAVEDFIAVNLAAKGYAATYAIHTDKAGNNLMRISSSPTGASTRRTANGLRSDALNTRSTRTASGYRS